MYKIHRVVFLFIIAFLFSSCGGSDDESGDDSGDIVSEGSVIVPNESKIYAGWYTHAIPEELEDFEVSFGATPPIVFTFHNWNNAGPEVDEPVLQTFDAPVEGGSGLTVLEVARDLASRESVLAIAWDAIGYPTEDTAYFQGTPHVPISFHDILSGEYDDYIRSCARQIKSLGFPVMLSPFAEVNSTGWFTFGANERTPLESVDDTRAYYGDPDHPDGPERIRDTYRHIVNIFREEQVDNVTWFLYTASGFMNPATLEANEVTVMDEFHPRYFYPGDDYVDWVGTSVYVVMDGEESLAYGLDHAISAYREVTGRPFIIPEFGVVAGLDQSRVLTLRALVETELPLSGVSAFGFADSELYEQVFSIPRLVNRPDEASVWSTIVDDTNHYSLRVKTVDRLQEKVIDK
jgi:alpha-glucosidase (family GH31 glycosyl hydrolase)